MRGVLPMPCVAVIHGARSRTLAGGGRSPVSELFRNDYLGLSHHPQIIRAWKQSRSNLASVAAAPVTSAVIAWQSGAGRRTGRVAGLFAGTAVFSGFAANQAVIAAMMAKEDRLLPTGLAMPHCWKLPV